MKTRNDFMRKGLYDPEHIKRVNEMRKTWKFVYPTQESITKLFEEIKQGESKNKLKEK